MPCYLFTAFMSPAKGARTLPNPSATAFGKASSIMSFVETLNNAKRAGPLNNALAGPCLLFAIGGVPGISVSAARRVVSSTLMSWSLISATLRKRVACSVTSSTAANVPERRPATTSADGLMGKQGDKTARRAQPEDRSSAKLAQRTDA